MFADWCIDSSRNKKCAREFCLVWLLCFFFSSCIHIVLFCCVVLHRDDFAHFFFYSALRFSLYRMYFNFVKWSQRLLCLLCSAFGINVNVYNFSQCWLDIIVDSQMIRFFRLPQNNMMNYTLFSAFCLLFKCYSIRWWSASHFTFNCFYVCTQKRSEIIILWNSFVFGCDVCNNKFGTFPMCDDKLSYICLFSSSIEFKIQKIHTQKIAF